MNADTANNPAAQTAPTKQAAKAPAAPKEPKNMATASDAKLSFNDLLKKQEELKAQQAEIETLIASKRTEEIKVLADGYAKKAAAAGFSPQEAVDALMAYLPAKAQRAAKGAKAPKGSKEPKHYADADSTGARPEVGKTYKLLDGTQYTKKPLGKSPGSAVEAAKVKTWAEMLVK